MSDTLLATAIDVQRWLREDRETAYAERLRRDRDIGRGQTQAGSIGRWSDLKRIVDWWTKVRSVAAGNSAAAVTDVGHRVIGLRRVAQVLLTVLGVVLGAVVGTVAFSYQGDYPVNLIALLGVLVGVPLLLLAGTLLLLPGWLPMGSAVRGALGGVNPARWAAGWLDRLTELRLFGATASGRVSAPFARWQLVVFSQWLAVGYFFGVVVAAWVLIAVTDLAFGWSSTLDLAPAQVHGWLTTLALPWSSWLPGAVPDAELVSASRFFRLETGGMPQARAVQLGQWWPFVLMMILTYGLLPRLLLLAFGGWRLRSATRRLLLDDPEVTALLDRLRTPSVSFEGDDLEGSLDIAEALSGPERIAVEPGTVGIVWNSALTPAQASGWMEAPDIRVLSLAVWDDAAAQRKRLGEELSGAARLLIFTKGWEPPLLEFLDFLDGVRSAIGPRTSITVVPINVAADAVEPADRDVWARALSRRDDPRLYVLQATERPIGVAP